MNLSGIFFFILFVFISGNLKAIEPIILESEFSGKPLGYNLDFFEDRDKSFNINQISESIRSKPGKIHWTSSLKESPGFGYTNSAYWVKFTLDNRLGFEEDMFLEVAYPLLDYIIFYEPKENGKFIERASGDKFPFNRREVSYRNFLFQFSAPPGRTSYYLRFETESSMVLSLWLWSPKKLQEKIANEGLVLGSYYGIIFVMACFNTFLFLSIRDKTYLIYVILIVTLGAFQAGLSGHGFQYLYPESAYLANAGIPVLMTASLFWIVQFTRYYLNTSATLPRTDLTIKIFSGLIAILGVVAFFGKYSLITPVAVVFAIICVISMNLIAIRCIMKKNRSAKFYIFAWGFMLSSILIYSLKTLTILPNNFFTNWSLLIGSTAEITLLSFGLADRMNTINQELKKAQSDLEKMSHVKDLFLSNISHEIRTPLATIYGYSELIDMAKSKEVKSIKDYNKEILSGSEELIGYINNLMLITDIESTPVIKKEKVNLLGVVRDIVFGLDKLSQKNTFQMKLNIPGKITVHTDPEFLKKSLEVFLRNAIVYSPPGSSGIISASQSENLLEIEIKDNGIGIEKEEIPKIFDKFYRIDSSLHYDVSGMGLGLFIAKRIISLLGGRVEVESESGKGSTFRIFLPAG